MDFSKNQFLKNLCSGTQCGGFQFLLILDLWGISFNAVVVVGLGKDLLFESVLGHCAYRRTLGSFENFGSEIQNWDSTSSLIWELTSEKLIKW